MLTLSNYKVLAYDDAIMPPIKRQKTMPPIKKSEEFLVAVICPLEVEALAMIRQLDEDKDYGEEFSKDCHFTLGGIGEHNIVVTSLPAGRQGHTSAAVAAQQTMAKFPKITYILLVGIAGGVPSDKHDIRLGDVVVSFPTGKYGGVVQYDFGKDEEQFKHSGQINSVPQQLLAYLISLQLRHGRNPNAKPKYLEYLEAQMTKIEKPDSSSDRLFPASYIHQGGSDCTTCDEKQAQNRQAREGPRVHYGLIASGNRVIKTAQQRDKYNQDHGGIILAYEMEAAGLMNFTPCLVIRGISDYADSHKPPGKGWHAYAAAVAAAYAREFIEIVQVEMFSGLQIIAKQKPHWHVPFGRNKQFVGRESELQEIIEKLNPESNEDDCQRVAIAGLGGIGKTQIALEAAFRIQKEFNDCSVFWVPAIDTASFERAYQKMGQKLQIPGINEDKADVKSLVKEFLSQESAGRWLLIVDNADDVEMLYNRAKESNESCGSPALADYLPFSRKGSILFTTRNRKVAVKQAGIDIVPLKEMSEIDSQKLLEMSLINKSLIEEKDTTTKLLKLLAHLPLAIRQAAAFLNENEISIFDYLKIYESDNEQMIALLGKDFEDQGRYNTIKNPIVSTWLISFRQILRYNQLAAEYLYIMSCVAQQDIPSSLLPSAPILLQQEALGILKAYAFITPHKGQYSYDIHRLVQVAVRNWLKTRNELSLWSGKTLAQITRVFPFFEYENRDECTRYLPHALCILDFPEFSENFEEPLATLLCNIGEYFLKTGKYPEAEQRYRQVLELREKVLGKDHLDTLMVKNKLATSLCHQDKYEEAEPMFRQTLQVRETVFGKDHPDTLVSMNNLALLLHEHHGKYVEAEAMHRQTLHIRERVLGKDHPNTLWSMNNLALSLFRQGKYTEAEAIDRQTLQIRETVLGKDHPDTLISRNNLAGSLRCQSKNAEVEAMYRETIQVQATVLGKDHPDTLLSMSNLALTLYGQGKYAEAEPMFRQTLQARETVLGKDHPDTLSTRRNLALPLTRQGKYTEAEALYRQTLRVQEAVLGKDHPATRMTTNYLTEILRRQRENADAEGFACICASDIVNSLSE